MRTTKLNPSLHVMMIQKHHDHRVRYIGGTSNFTWTGLGIVSYGEQLRIMWVIISRFGIGVEM